MVTTRVRSLFGVGQSFCLWVPLRTSTNCGNVDPIEPYYPGDETPGKLLGPRHFEQAAAILSLLARLKLVQFRFSEQGRDVAHDIRIKDSASRRAELTLSNSPGEGILATFEGQVASTNADSTRLVNYSGAEHRLDDAGLSTEHPQLDVGGGEFSDTPSLKVLAENERAAACDPRGISTGHGLNAAEVVKDCLHKPKPLVLRKAVGFGQVIYVQRSNGWCEREAYWLRHAANASPGFCVSCAASSLAISSVARSITATSSAVWRPKKFCE